MIRTHAKCYHAYKMSTASASELRGTNSLLKNAGSGRKTFRELRSCSAHGATGRSLPGFSQLHSTQKLGIAFDLIHESPLANSTRISPSRAVEPVRKCFRVEDPVFLDSMFFIRSLLGAYLCPAAPLRSTPGSTPITPSALESFWVNFAG
jgi:hypothetical protein